MNLGKAFKNTRKEKGMTQAAFAEAIGIKQSYLSLVENGRARPSTKLLEKLSEYSDVPLPMMVWHSIEEKDIRPEMLESFNRIKPILDGMIESLSQH